MNGLTPKQYRFCQEYLIDLNATQAAIRAGYSSDSAYSIGSENLTKPEIQSRVQKLIQERNKATSISAERVVHEISKVAFASIGSFIKVTDDGMPYVDMAGMTLEELQAVADVQVDAYSDNSTGEAREVRKVKIKLHDKLRALDMLAKHTGLYDKTDADQYLEPVDLDDIRRRLNAGEFVDEQQLQVADTVLQMKAMISGGGDDFTQEKHVASE